MYVVRYTVFGVYIEVSDLLAWYCYPKGESKAEYFVVEDCIVCHEVHCLGGRSHYAVMCCEGWSSHPNQRKLVYQYMGFRGSLK